MQESKVAKPSYLEAQERKVEKRRIEPVAKATVKKKSATKRLVQTFISEDKENVKDYILNDVLVPAIKNTIVDLIQKTSEMLFFGEVRSRNRNESRVSYRNYASYSRPETSRREPRVRSSLTVDDVLFETRDDAQHVIDVLEEALDKYEEVSVADFYDAAGISAESQVDYYFGWKDISSAFISRSRSGDGYYINMPRIIDLK